jgi:hypothetical protein
MKPQAGQVGRIVPWSSRDSSAVPQYGQKRASGGFLRAGMLES